MTKQEFFIAEDHPRRIVFLTVEKTFPLKPDDKPEVTFSWGTSSLDQSKTSFWNRKYKGELEFDEHFQLYFHHTANQ